MSLILLIPILVSGFIYCNNRYSEYIKLHRYQGQYLYLESAKFGLFLTTISCTVIFLVTQIFPTFCEDIHNQLISIISSTSEIQDEKQSKQYATYIIISISSIGFSYISSIFLNFVDIVIKTGYPHPIPEEQDRTLYKYLVEFINTAKRRWLDTKIIMMNNVLSDSPIDKLFIDSYTKREPLLLTLSNKKVYVGIVIVLGEPNESVGMDQEIGIFPWLSGYRDDKNHKITFTTSYQDDNSHPQQVKPAEYIVIRQDLIVSASAWNIETYRKVNYSNFDYSPLSNEQ